MTGVIEVRRRGFQKRVCRLAPRMRQYWRSSRETRTSPMPSSLHEKMFAMRRSYGERDETNSSQSRNGRIKWQANRRGQKGVISRGWCWIGGGGHATMRSQKRSLERAALRILWSLVSASRRFTTKAAVTRWLGLKSGLTYPPTWFRRAFSADVRSDCAENHESPREMGTRSNCRPR